MVHEFSTDGLGFCCLLWCCLLKVEESLMQKVFNVIIIFKDDFHDFKLLLSNNVV